MRRSLRARSQSRSTIKDSRPPGREWESGLITESQAVAQEIAPFDIRHVGVALEHTPGDADVISAAMGLASRPGMRITLIHIVDTPGAEVYGPESRTLHSAGDEAYLEEMAREIEVHGPRVETLLSFGRTVEGIVRAVEMSGIDLLVLGSHGHRGLEDLFYGGTVTGVRHAVDIPVLVVRARGVEQAQRDP